MRTAIVRAWAERLGRAGALPEDSPDERLRKAALTLSSIVVIVLASVWVASYLPRTNSVL